MNTTEIPQEIENLIMTIERDQLVLPTMPDWAMKIQTMLDDINVSAAQIVTVLSGDPVFMAQLIRMANSAIYAGKPRVNTVVAAVNRLGYKMLRSLIVKVSMTKLTNANHPVIKRHLNDFMDHSRQVAAISYLLARDQRHLNPDEAMLAGLVHDIGILPICIYADKNISVIDEQVCNVVIRKYCGQIGEKLLTQWAFPDAIISIPAIHENLQYDSGSHQASYIDVVTVANLLSQPNAKFFAWENVAAIKRLGMSPEDCCKFNDRFGYEVTNTRKILFDS